MLCTRRRQIPRFQGPSLLAQPVFLPLRNSFRLLSLANSPSCHSGRASAWAERSKPHSSRVRTYRTQSRISDLDLQQPHPTPSSVLHATTLPLGAKASVRSRCCKWLVVAVRKKAPGLLCWRFFRHPSELPSTALRFRTRGRAQILSKRLLEALQGSCESTQMSIR